MSIKILESTIKEAQLVVETVFEGTGLHTGERVLITIKNNPEKDGIIFVYEGIKKKVDPSILNTKEKTTSIVHDKKVFVACIEHLMSAFYGLGILNVIVEVVGGREIPILSGNSFSFIEKLLPNIEYTTVKSQSIIVTKPIVISDDCDKSRYIKLSPSNDNFFQIKSCVFYTNSYTTEQNFSFNFKDNESYIEKISHARTSFPFKVGNEKEYVQLLKRLKGAVIRGKNRNINTYSEKDTEKTFYKNEIARHKILDFLGDFKTTGVNLVGTTVELHRTGHALNIKLANLIFKELKK